MLELFHVSTMELPRAGPSVEFLLVHRISPGMMFASGGSIAIQILRHEIVIHKIARYKIADSSGRT